MGDSSHVYFGRTKYFHCDVTLNHCTKATTVNLCTARSFIKSLLILLFTNALEKSKQFLIKGLFHEDKFLCKLKINSKQYVISKSEVVKMKPRAIIYLVTKSAITFLPSYEDISCIADAPSLSEVSLDGNPFSQDINHKSIILRNVKQIRQLDMKRITEDERRISNTAVKREEEKKKETSKLVVLKV